VVTRERALQAVEERHVPESVESIKIQLRARQGLAVATIFDERRGAAARLDLASRMVGAGARMIHGQNS
jgi:hypothetical protein